MGNSIVKKQIPAQECSGVYMKKYLLFILFMITITSFYFYRIKIKQNEQTNLILSEFDLCYNGNDISCVMLIYYMPKNEKTYPRNVKNISNIILKRNKYLCFQENRKEACHYGASLLEGTVVEGYHGDKESINSMNEQCCKVGCIGCCVKFKNTSSEIGASASGIVKTN